MSTRTQVKSPVELNAELADLVSEAIGWTADAGERAQVVIELMGCVHETLVWRVGAEEDPSEEVSMSSILQEAQAHHRRMLDRQQERCG